MRYQNWDVLIFPQTGDSKTPLQEFGAFASVTQDPDAAPQSSNAHPAFFIAVTHPVPTVSCYIPSIPPGAPFRISLHSWVTPVASRETASVASQESMVWFEAKVLVDGVCTAGMLFNTDPPWPQVIDMCSQIDKDGNHDQLRFPPFHQAMLTQTWANPAQNIGRVKIIIAEGIHYGQGISGFEKKRNLVCFSFQHAPQNILESCGIAWPNQGMWYQAAQQFHAIPSPRADHSDPDMHGHSPRRREASTDGARSSLKAALGPTSIPHALMCPPGFRPHGTQCEDPFWGTTSEPFAGGVKPNGLHKTAISRNTTGSGDISMKDKSRSTTGSHDEPMPDISQPRSPASSHRSYPMPDYSRPISLASTRNTSENTNHGKDPTRLVSMLHQGLAKHVHDEEYHFDDYVVSLSPRKDSNYSGISAPSNTRVSSAANTPPGRPSAAAEIRALSYSGMPRSVSVTTRDPPPPNYRVLSSGGKPHSNSHTSDSRHSEIQTEIEERPDAKPKKKPVGRPAGSVKGRKEGRTSETTLEALTSKTRRRVSAPSASSCEKESSDESDEKIGGEGKRKRGTKLAESMVSLEDRLDNANSSPTRKVSKTGHKEENPVDIADMDDLTAEGVVVRHPLGELDNIV